MVAALAHAAGCVDRDNQQWHLLVARIPNGEHLTRPHAIAAVGRIASAVGVPVTADIEAGYGPAPADVAETVATVIDAKRREWPSRTAAATRAGRCGPWPGSANGSPGAPASAARTGIISRPSASPGSVRDGYREPRVLLAAQAG